MADEKNQAKETEQAQPETQHNELAVLSGRDTAVMLQKMSVEDRLSFLRKMGEYIGAETSDVNKLLNKPIEVCGIIIHEATIGQEGKRIDPATGEIITTVNYQKAPRTVMKLKDGNVLGFVAMSIESYARDFLIPAFGLGDWKDKDGNPLYVTIEISQLESKRGRVYNVRVV